MRYRRLGESGPELSVVGMGCWGIGGPSPEWGWGPQDDRTSIRTIHQAVEVGVNWFDTAPTYGLGHSESIVGRAVADIRDKVVIATKFGRTWDEHGHLGRTGRYDWIVSECEASLKRLGTDYIDLYQMHWPDTQTLVPVEESMRAASDLVAAGKVRYVGVCNFDVTLLQQAMESCRVVSVQPKYNLLDRTAEKELIPFCRRHGLGVVAYSVLASGLLSGELTRKSRLPSDDWRAQDEEFSGERLARSLALVERLRTLAADMGASVPQLAVAWVLRDVGVTSAIVGLRSPAHVEGIVQSADLALEPAAVNAIESFISSVEAQ